MQTKNKLLNKYSAKKKNHLKSIFTANELRSSSCTLTQSKFFDLPIIKNENFDNYKCIYNSQMKTKSTWKENKIHK